MPHEALLDEGLEISFPTIGIVPLHPRNEPKRQAKFGCIRRPQSVKLVISGNKNFLSLCDPSKTHEELSVIGKLTTVLRIGLNRPLIEGLCPVYVATLPLQENCVVAE